MRRRGRCKCGSFNRNLQNNGTNVQTGNKPKWRSPYVKTAAHGKNGVGEGGYHGIRYGYCGQRVGSWNVHRNSASNNAESEVTTR